MPLLLQLIIGSRRCRDRFSAQLICKLPTHCGVADLMQRHPHGSHLRIRRWRRGSRVLDDRGEVQPELLGYVEGVVEAERRAPAKRSGLKDDLGDMSGYVLVESPAIVARDSARGVIRDLWHRAVILRCGHPRKVPRRPPARLRLLLEAWRERAPRRLAESPPPVGSCRPGLRATAAWPSPFGRESTAHPGAPLRGCVTVASSDL